MHVGARAAGVLAACSLVFGGDLRPARSFSLCDAGAWSSRTSVTVQTVPEPPEPGPCHGPHTGRPTVTPGPSPGPRLQARGASPSPSVQRAPEDSGPPALPHPLLACVAGVLSRGLGLHHHSPVGGACEPRGWGPPSMAWDLGTPTQPVAVPLQVPGHRRPRGAASWLTSLCSKLQFCRGEFAFGTGGKRRRCRKGSRKPDAECPPRPSKPASAGSSCTTPTAASCPQTAARSPTGPGSCGRPRPPGGASRVGEPPPPSLAPGPFPAAPLQLSGGPWPRHVPGGLKSLRLAPS